MAFTNFNCQLIHKFSKITILLILILKTSKNEVFSTLNPSEIRTLYKKKNNIQANIYDNSRNIITIWRGGRAKIMASKLGFLTSEAKIVFI